MDENTRMREASGTVVDEDPLVSFLYELMRDHLPVGTVEALVRNCPPDQKTVFTNGWLAQIARDQAERLRGK